MKKPPTSNPMMGVGSVFAAIDIERFMVRATMYGKSPIAK